MMNRQKAADNLTINYDLSPFMPHNTNMTRSASFENDSIESLKEKLQIKSEALNLLAKQLELCNKEKVEYKRLIDTLYDKNLSLKKSLYFKENEVETDDFTSINSKSSKATFNSNERSKTFSSNTNSSSSRSKYPKTISPNSSTSTLFNDIDSEDYLKILKDLVKTLQREKYDLIQKYEESQQQLQDSRMDLRLLREQIVRQRVGSINEGLTTSIRLDSTNHFASQANNLSSNSTTKFKEDLIKEIELLREQKTITENDLKLALCQKEEIEIERDSFKDKYIKLNEFLIETSSIYNTPLTKQLNESNSSNHTICFDSTDETTPTTNNNNSIKLELNVLDKNNNTSNPSKCESKSFNLVLDKTVKSQISFSIDEMLSQNKYLTESNNNLREEIEILKNTIKKYKLASSQTSMAPTSTTTMSTSSTTTTTPFTTLISQPNSTFAASNNSNYLQFNKNDSSSSSSSLSLLSSNGLAESKLINKKNIESLLNKVELFLKEHNLIQSQLGIYSSSSGGTSHTNSNNNLIDLIIELKLLVDSLLENLNDRIIAGVHQRKVNKMLATRIQDLEKQIEIYFSGVKLNDQIGFDSSSSSSSLSLPCSNNKHSSPISASSLSISSNQQSSLIKPLTPEQLNNPFKNLNNHNNNIIGLQSLGEGCTSSTSSSSSYSKQQNVNRNSSVNYLIKFEDDESNNQNK